MDTKNLRRGSVSVITDASCSELFLFQRVTGGWQFVQGGQESRETDIDCSYREMYEETGIGAEQVEALYHGRTLHKYYFPKDSKFFNRDGQQMHWHLYRLLDKNPVFNFNPMQTHAEFSDSKLVSYWYPVHTVYKVKRDFYSAGLMELLPHFVKAHNMHS